MHLIVQRLKILLVFCTSRLNLFQRDGEVYELINQLMWLAFDLHVKKLCINHSHIHINKHYSKNERQK